MILPKVLILREPEGERAALANAIPKEGCEATEALIGSSPDIVADYCAIILDVTSVTRSLLEFCAKLRNANSTATLMVVGNPISEAKRIAVLDAGSDAFLEKPVLLAELEARIRTALRRTNGGRPATRRRVSMAGRVVDFDARSVSGKGLLHLTPIEWNLLENLVARANQTIPGEELVQKIWGTNSARGVHSLRVFIKSLRSKLEPDPKHPRYILTDPAIGYRLQVPGSDLLR
jgi:two-component system KDP operon response regulator KdpE